MSQQTQSDESDVELPIDYPSKGFADEYGVERIDRPSVTLVVERNVVSPLLIRNSEDGRAETQTFNGTVRAQCNPEKFISKERLTGLDLLRTLDVDESLISDDYRYNQARYWEEVLNLDPLTYGVAGTEKNADTFSIKSHITAGYTFTADEYNINNEEVRNATYETGSMSDFNVEEEHVDDKFDQSTSLYNHTPIQPGNKFVHFITLESSLPGMLLYTVHNLLNTSDYGARETRHGRNVRNRILGVIQADHPVTLSTGELLMMYESESGDVLDDIVDYVSDVEQDHWNVYIEDSDVYPDYPQWFRDTLSIGNRSDLNAGEKLQTILTNTTQTIRDTLSADDGD